MTPYSAPIIQAQPGVVIKTFCEAFGIYEKKVYSPSREDQVSILRHTLMYLIHNCLFITNDNTAAIFNRTPSMVSHSKKTVEDLWKTNLDYRKKVTELCKETRLDLGLTNLK